MERYVDGPCCTLWAYSRVLLNGTILHSTSQSSGREFCRSVVSVNCEYEKAGEIVENYLEYGIARFYAEVELFPGKCHIEMAVDL